jgi:hypothetical protein
MWATRAPVGGEGIAAAEDLSARSRSGGFECLARALGECGRAAVRKRLRFCRAPVLTVMVQGLASAR